MTSIPPAQNVEQKSTFFRDTSIIGAGTILPATYRRLQMKPAVVESGVLRYSDYFVSNVKELSNVRQAAQSMIDALSEQIANMSDGFKKFLAKEPYFDVSKIEGEMTLKQAEDFVKSTSSADAMLSKAAKAEIENSGVVTNTGKLATTIEKKAEPIAKAFKNARLLSAAKWGAIGFLVSGIAVLAYHLFGEDDAEPANAKKSAS